MDNKFKNEFEHFLCIEAKKLDLQLSKTGIANGHYMLYDFEHGEIKFSITGRKNEVDTVVKEICVFLEERNIEHKPVKYELEGQMLNKYCLDWETS